MCPNSDLGPAISMHNELIVRANWVDNFNCMWAFWQLILCPLFVDSFFPCVYLLQHYSWGSPVARDSHTYVGGGCSVCMWLAQHAKKRQQKQSPSALSSVPPSLSFSPSAVQALENLWPHVPPTHSQTAYWYHVCVCDEMRPRVAHTDKKNK